MPAPKIAITYSIEEKAAPYALAIEAAGGEPVLINVREPCDPQLSLLHIDGLLLTGGADVTPSLYGEAVDPAANVRNSPERDAHELPLLKAALQRDLPILGICRGMQLLNVALGGKLIQDLPNHRPTKEETATDAPPPEPEKPFRHKVFVPPGSRLTTIFGLAGFLDVNSYHHQGLKLKEKAPEIVVSAYSLKDGIIECLECPKTMFNWVVAVQWHPERKDELPSYHQKLFKQFIFESDAARA